MFPTVELHLDYSNPCYDMMWRYFYTFTGTTGRRGSVHCYK